MYLIISKLKSKPVEFNKSFKMSCTTEIRSNESHFKLARKMLDVLAAKFNFSATDAWPEVCSTPLEGLLKKFKKDRQQSNPYKDITRARTSFSLFTMERRAGIVAQNPGADFVAVSKLVSKAWNSLSDVEKQVFKDKELKDKDRYRQECAAVVVPVATPSTDASATSTTSTPSTDATKPAKASKVAKPVSAAVAPSSATPKKAKAPKQAASATPTPAPASASASASTASTASTSAATPSKKSSGKKATPAAATPAPVASVAVAAVASAAVDAKKSATPKPKAAKKTSTPVATTA
jgi:hypothetical protein